MDKEEKVVSFSTHIQKQKEEIKLLQTKNNELQVMINQKNDKINYFENTMSEFEIEMNRIYTVEDVIKVNKVLRKENENIKLKIKLITQNTELKEENKKLKLELLDTNNKNKSNIL